MLAWATYTDPEVAHVGLTADQARERGLAVETVTVAMSEIDRAFADGDDDGFIRLHVHPVKGTIHGATFVCRRAGDLVSEVTTAIHAGLGLGDGAFRLGPGETGRSLLRRRCSPQRLHRTEVELVPLEGQLSPVVIEELGPRRGEVQVGEPVEVEGPGGPGQERDGEGRREQPRCVERAHREQHLR